MDRARGDARAAEAVAGGREAGTLRRAGSPEESLEESLEVVAGGRRALQSRGT